MPVEITEGDFEAGYAMLLERGLGRFKAVDGEEHIFSAGSIAYINRRSEQHKALSEARAAVQARTLKP